MKKQYLNVILLVGSAVNFFYAIANIMYSALLPSIMKTYSLSASGMSLMDITEMVGSCAAMIFTMLLADRLSKGKALAIGMCLFGLAASLIGTAPPFAVFLLIRASMGMFGCFIDTMVTAYVSDVFGERRGSAMTVVHTLYSVGSIIAPISVAYMLEVIPDWRIYYVVDGLILLVTGVFFFIFATRSGMLGDKVAPKIKKAIPFRRIFTNRQIITVMIVTALMATEIYFRIRLPTFLLSIDPVRYPVTKTSVMVSLYSLGSVVGKLFYATIAHRIRSYQKLWISCFITGALFLSAVFVGSLGFWYFVMVTGGLIHGSNFSVKYQMACDAEPEFSATVSAAVSFCSSIGSILFSWIAGAVGEAAGFGPLMYISPIALMAAGLLTFLGYRKGSPGPSSSAANEPS